MKHKIKIEEFHHYVPYIDLVSSSEGKRIRMFVNPLTKNIRFVVFYDNFKKTIEVDNIVLAIDKYNKF